MAKKSNMTPTVGSINETSVAENITTLASILKKYGIQPGESLALMLKKSNPQARKAIFTVVLIFQIIILVMSAIGAYYRAPSMVPVSLGLSVGTISVLWFSYRVIKGKIKYFLLLIDIALGMFNAHYFVKTSMGHAATAELQRTYIRDEVDSANSILRDARAYIYYEQTLYTIADSIAKMEAAIKGQVHTTAMSVKNVMRPAVDDSTSIPEVIELSEEITYHSINSLSEAKEVASKAHEDIVRQLNTALAAAQAFKSRAATVNSAVIWLYNDSTLSSTSQRSNANILFSAVDGVNSHPDFKYYYTPKYVETTVLTKGESLLAYGPGIGSLLFLIFLMIVMTMEEKDVNMSVAIAESKKLLAKKLAATWNIELGVDPEIDDMLTVILEWLEDHENIRKAMVRHSITLADFISLYKKFDEDILEMVNDGSSRFGLHELEGGLIGESSDNYKEIIRNFTYNEWLLLKRLVSDAYSFACMTNISVVLTIWGSPCRDGKLDVTSELEDIFDLLKSHTDLQKAIKTSGATMQQYVDLYNMYGETILLECARPGANFSIGNLVDSLPDRISDDVLNNTKAAHLSILDKYDISVSKWAALSSFVQDGLLEVIQLLEARITDDAQCKAYVATMMNNLNIFTVDIVGAWKVLIQQVRELKVLLGITPSILVTLTAAETPDIVAIINPYKDTSALKMLAAWRKEYSDIIAEWKRKNIYDLEMQNIFNNAASAGLNGIPTLMASYQKADKQLQELVKKDERTRDERKKEKEKKRTEGLIAPLAVVEPAAEPVVTEERSSTLLELHVPEEEPATPAVAEPVPTPEPVAEEEAEEPLPERRVVLDITLSQLQKAKDETAKLAVLEKAFKVETVVA